MKKGWETKRLGDVCEFNRGLTYSKKDEVSNSKNIVFRSNNIDLKTHTLNFSELKYISPRIVIPKDKIVKKGSLLICTANGSKNHLGKVALIDQDYGYAFGGFMGQLTPNNNITSKYLFYNLTSDEYSNFILKLSDGANINNLTFNQLKEYVIKVPPLPEQKRIVKILDGAFEQIEKAKEIAEQNLQNAKEIFNSALSSIFTNENNSWEEKRLGEVCEFKSGTTIDKKLEKSKGNVIYAKVGDMNLKGNENYITTSSRYVNFEDIGQNHIIGEGAIIFPKRGGAIATNKKRRIIQPTIVDLNIMALVPKKTIHKDYLYFWFKQIELSDLSNGTSIPQINNYSFDNVFISFPKSISEQKSIVAKLDVLSEETNRLQAIYQQKLNDLEELKKSILHKVFDGEL